MINNGIIRTLQRWSISRMAIQDQWHVHLPLEESQEVVLSGLVLKTSPFVLGPSSKERMNDWKSEGRRTRGNKCFLFILFVWFICRLLSIPLLLMREDIVIVKQGVLSFGYNKIIHYYNARVNIITHLKYKYSFSINTIFWFRYCFFLFF